MHWIDNADSWICPVCRLEVSNPNHYEGCRCPQCGFQDPKDAPVADMSSHPSGVPLSKSQCKNLAEFIEFNLLDNIRKDDDIDNLEWVRDMLAAHKKLMEASGKRWDDEKECWVVEK